MTQALCFCPLCYNGGRGTSSAPVPAQRDPVAGSTSSHVQGSTCHPLQPPSRWVLPICQTTLQTDRLWGQTGSTAPQNASNGVKPRGAAAAQTAHNFWHDFCNIIIPWVSLEHTDENISFCFRKYSLAVLSAKKSLKTYVLKAKKKPNRNNKINTPHLIFFSFKVGN